MPSHMKFRMVSGGFVGTAVPRTAAKKNDVTDKLVDAIIARPGLPFTEDDRDFLEAGDPERLVEILGFVPTARPATGDQPTTARGQAPEPIDLTARIRERARGLAKRGRAIIDKISGQPLRDKISHKTVDDFIAGAIGAPLRKAPGSQDYVRPMGSSPSPDPDLMTRAVRAHRRGLNPSRAVREAKGE